MRFATLGYGHSFLDPPLQDSTAEGRSMEPCSTAEFPEHHSRNCLCWELRGTSLPRNQLRLQHQHSSSALDACLSSESSCEKAAVQQVQQQRCRLLQHHRIEYTTTATTH